MRPARFVCHAFSLAALTALLLGVSPAVVGADPITFDLSGTDSAGTFGNSRTYTFGGVTLTATAWAYTFDKNGGTDNALQSAALGRWGTGVGVCDQSEGSNCGNPAHQVDNAGPDNWVLMTFDTLVDLASVNVDPFGVWDTDASYWVGNVDTATLNLNGKAYTDLAALGFEARRDDTGGIASDAPRNIAINQTQPFVNAILFGTYVGEFSGSNVDRFKVKSVTVTNSVPEPVTLLLTGVGLAGLALRRRTRKRA